MIFFHQIFDSLGVTESEVKERLGKTSGHVFYNTSRFQPPSSTACARYACYFIFVRFLNFDETYDQVVEAYLKPDDLDWNEKRVAEWWMSGRLTSVLDESTR